METDWPWMEVSKERLEEARDALIDAGLDVEIDPNQDRDPRDTRVEKWYAGHGMIGYVREGGVCFLHPNYMEPEEKVDLTYPYDCGPPGSMFEELKSSSGRAFIGVVKVCLRDFDGDSYRMAAAIKELREEFGDLIVRLGHLDLETNTFEEVRQQLVEAKARES